MIFRKGYASRPIRVARRLIPVSKRIKQKELQTHLPEEEGSTSVGLTMMLQAHRLSICRESMVAHNELKTMHLHE
jgi:hypothetical protein